MLKTDLPAAVLMWAWQDLADGRPVDFGAVRARLVQQGDQWGAREKVALDASAPEVAAISGQQRRFAQHAGTVVDALERGDFDGAAVALRDALRITYEELDH